MQQCDSHQPGRQSDPADCRRLAESELIQALVAVRERRLEWEALFEGRARREGAPGQRLEKLIAMRSFPSRWKLTRLMEALSDVEPVRAEALDQLAREWRDRRTRALLYSLLWRNDPGLAHPAARAVLDHAPQDRVLLLRAVGVLRHTRDSEVAPMLLPHLQSDDEQLRLATVAAIEYAAPPATLTRALLPLRHDPCPAVARAALQAFNGGERVDLFRSLPRNFNLPTQGATGGSPVRTDVADPSAKRLLALALLFQCVIAPPWMVIFLLLFLYSAQPLWLLVAALPVWGVVATRLDLIRQRECSGFSLAPLLSAVAELNSTTNHDELQKLLRPLERIARDVVRENWETRKACRQAAEHIRRLTAETRDLPRVDVASTLGHDLPRTLQDRQPAAQNSIEEELPAEALPRLSGRS